MPDDIPEPADAPVEALPEQEEFWRPPVRFGSIPVEKEPLGWDRRRAFQKLYPRVPLPFQIMERVPLGVTEPHEPNRLIWGDNLHIMRQLPTASVDLIYIDPPFFSGREYNVLWGDQNERRSFDDIWEGGMPGYLIWLNARLLEMKRLLKPTGSIYVHCDWHASHYIKVEMDKIFGYENFRNEIVWHYYNKYSAGKSAYGRNFDSVLFYASSRKTRFVPQREKRDEPRRQLVRENVDGVLRNKRGPDGKVMYRMVHDRKVDAVWAIPAVQYASPERVGYPTQKPEALLDRIIRASSNEGDTVLDAFVGGGTTPIVAQRLGRRWIAIDQSRVAVAVTAERLKTAAIERGMEDAPIPDFKVEQWGVYESKRLSTMPAPEFREFVLRSWGTTRGARDGEDPLIHGWRNQLPVWVGEPGRDSQATPEDVLAFANAIRRTELYREANLRDGVMLAWGFTQAAAEAAAELRGQESIGLDFVRIKQVGIGGGEFREHIVGRSTDKADYGEFLTFVQPPVVSVGYRANGGRAVTFDADTTVINHDSEIINVQWDFNHDGKRFTATKGYTFRDKKTKGPAKRVTYKFPRTGTFEVACRVQDSRGGEGMWTGKVEVE